LTEPQRRYAVSWVRRVFSQVPEKTIIPEDLLALVFRELSRQEELENDVRDQWGNWEWPYSQSTKDGTLFVPRVDIAVQNWAKICGIKKSFFRWPDNKPFAMCLTHDVDFISRRATSIRFVLELTRRCVRIKNGKWEFFASQFLRNAVKYLAGPLLRFHGKDEYHCFDTCMELENQYGFKSTFFFFAEHLPAPHIWDCGYSHLDRVMFHGFRTTVRGMMREMLQRGWDIGLHGSYNAATKLDALLSEKEQMEQSTGIPISAIRHHYLHYDARFTPVLHQQAGLKVDSTIGFNRNIGFRSGSSFPHFCWNHQEQQTTNVLEIPLHIMDGTLMALQGLECNTGMAMAYVKMMMDQVASVGGCLTLNWHPSWLSLKPYREIYELTLCEANRRNAWGCSVRDIYQHFFKCDSAEIAEAD